MKKIICGLLLVSIISSVALCGCSANKTTEPNTTATSEVQTTGEVNKNGTSEETLEQIKTAVDSDIKTSLFKGVVYICKDNNVIYQNGIGKADKKNDIDNSTDTVFCIASVTKQFTAASVLMLEEQQKLSLDDTLDKYFPDYEYGKSITIHQLLCMRSGIEDYIISDRNSNTAESVSSKISDLGISTNATADQNRKSIEKWIFSRPLKFTPNEKYEYTNSGYMLLGEIIEQVSGMSYEDFVKKNIFEPLQMTASGFTDTWNNDSLTVAKGYEKSFDLEWLDYKGVEFACGNIMSNAVDIAKWADGLLNGKVLGSESLKKMTTSYSQSGDNVLYGYGLMLSADGKTIYHAGALPPYYSMLIMQPESKYVQICLNNTNISGIETISLKVAKDIQDILTANK